MASVLTRISILAFALSSGLYGVYCGAFPGSGHPYTPRPQLVQQVSLLTGVVGTSATAAVGSTGSGNLIVAAFASPGNSQCVTSVTDNGASGGNTYSLVPGTPAFDTGGGGNTQIFYAPNSHSGATTITAHLAAACNGFNSAMFYAEFTNLNTLDGNGVAKNNAVSSTTPSAPAFTTTTDRSVVVTVVSVLNSLTGLHTGSTFTRFTNIVAGDSAAFQFTSGPGTYTATFDQNVSGSYAGSTAAFKP
jgi:hypothetical protein